MSNFFGWISVLAMLFLTGCMTKSETDKPNKGSIKVSADISFEPVIREQVQMYEASFPETKINVTYKPEADCLKDLFYDSTVSLVLITREITPKEQQFLRSKDIIPAQSLIAKDAVTILLNKSSNDSMYTMQRLEQMLLGKADKGKTVVFDGLSATSTVRYITDSVLKGKPFDTSMVKAAASSKEVIDFVSKNPNAIGLVGFSWIGNPEIPDQAAARKNLKFAYVQCNLCPDSPYIRPQYETIVSNYYPLVRGLYFVLKDNYMGLGQGFTSFMRYERGQLIFKRFYLSPIMDFDTRNVFIK